MVINTTKCSLSLYFSPDAGALRVHLTQLVNDEPFEALVVRGVPRIDESVVICILRREVPQGFPRVRWDVIQRRATFAAASPEVTRQCSRRPESGFRLAEVVL